MIKLERGGPAGPGMGRTLKENRGDREGAESDGG